MDQGSTMGNRNWPVLTLIHKSKIKDPSDSGVLSHVWITQYSIDPEEKRKHCHVGM